MGFRSGIITECSRFKITDEFRRKYSWLNIPEQSDDGYCYGIISSKEEVKFYAPFTKTEIFLDLQAQLEPSEDCERKIVVILLHECGGISKVEITKSSILGLEPTEWKGVEAVGHNYCYGCSDYRKAVEEKEV